MKSTTKNPFIFIMGPCVIESEELAFDAAGRLKEITAPYVESGDMKFIFKASYDKANRTSINSFRGPGLDRGIEILAKIKENLSVPVISDVHGIHEVEKAAKVLDVLQIPAFLCRQTDFLIETAKTGKTVNVKKGQFLSPWDMKNVVYKIESTGNNDIILTERGASFGYNNLVSDMRSIPIMQETGHPVVFDATHSVQLPGGSGDSSGGERRYAPVLAKAAVAAGADGIFMEVHPNPDKALCDGPNSMKLDDMPALIKTIIAVRRAVSEHEASL